MRVERKGAPKHSCAHRLRREVRKEQSGDGPASLGCRRHPRRGGLDAQTVMKLIGVIPARYASTRFPGKPLALIAGKPLLQHVIERCKGARFLDEVIVATDDQRIRDVAIKFCRVEMTSADHPSGTDRVAEVVQRTQ